jgi:hypothetical protein
VVDATQTALGLNIGDPVEVDVVPATAASLRWTSSDGHTQGPSGRVQGTAGTTLSFSVLTWTASPQSWFEIHVAGLDTPIRIWIK